MKLSHGEPHRESVAALREAAQIVERGRSRFAEVGGVSKQEVRTRAIHEMAAPRGHEARVADASRRVRARYADLIERLGR